LHGFSSASYGRSEIEQLIGTVREHADDLIFVLVAFDGVLAEYHEDPKAVRLSPERRELLLRLIRHPGVAVGVVSGRRMHDLRQRVGLGDEVFYIGLHGLEVVGPGFTRIEHQTFEQYREPLREITAAVEPLISRIDGVHLEDKEAVLALHTRQASSRDAVWARLHLLGRAGETADLHAFRMLRGNHVLELLPNIGSARAAAIAAVRDFLESHQGRRVFAVYVGEDLAEDDGYEAIARHGLVAALGKRAQVDHHLESIGMVDQLLMQLATLGDPPGEPNLRS
jgi:trehalose-phosphatase